MQPLTFGPPVITIDIEDWPQSTWNRDLPISNRAADNTRRILRILKESGVHATLFILGKFAETFPEIVREIRADGHEVGCHGYGHVEIFKQSPKEFSYDVSRSKDILEKILNEAIKGYRAPDFSIINRTLYALEVLANAGFEYDSSIFPIRHKRYGIPEWPISPTRVDLANGHSIIEVPIATFRCFNKNWPVGGGGYHRLLPGNVSRYLAGSVMQTVPFTLYCHPYELDVREFKEIPHKIPLSIRLHQGIGRRWFEKRLKMFLHRFGGQRVEDLLTSREWPTFKPDSISPATL